MYHAGCPLRAAVPDGPDDLGNVLRREDAAAVRVPWRDENGRVPGRCDCGHIPRSVTVGVFWDGGKHLQTRKPYEARRKKEVQQCQAKTCQCPKEDHWSLVLSDQHLPDLQSQILGCKWLGHKGFIGLQVFHNV